MVARFFLNEQLDYDRVFHAWIGQQVAEFVVAPARIQPVRRVAKYSFSPGDLRVRLGE